MSSPRVTRLGCGFGTQPHGLHTTLYPGNPTGGGSGLPGPGERVRRVFPWPQSHHEYYEQKVLIDGILWPESMVVEVDGREYGEPFAPDPLDYSRRII